MNKIVRIDAPGAGKWIMEKVQGVFTPDWDHSISSHRSDTGRIIGGFALCAYLGGSITVHMASNDDGWCSRDMLWMTFDYVFNQLGCRKALALVRSNNYTALAMDLRAGWQIEAIIRDAYPDAHMLVLTMTRDTCKWLRVKPTMWMAGSLKECA